MVTTKSSSKDKNHWLLNSACSNHMTPKVELFIEIDANHRSIMKVGNGYILQATGNDKIVVKTALGTKYVFNVLLVLEISPNLLSVG